MSDLKNNLDASVTIVEGCLIVTLPNDIADDHIQIGISRILMRVNKSSVKGVILELSMISALDSHSFEVLKKASKAVSLMGVMIVWVGLKPGVVSALLDLNADVNHIKAAMNLEQGLRIILDSQLSKCRGNR